MAMSQADRLKKAYEAQLAKQSKRKEQLALQLNNKNRSKIATEYQARQTPESGKGGLLKQSVPQLGNSLLNEQQKGTWANSTRQLDAQQRESEQLPRMASYRTEIKVGQLAITSDDSGDERREESKTLPTTLGHQSLKAQQRVQQPPRDTTKMLTFEERKALRQQQSYQLQQHLSRSRSRERDVQPQQLLRTPVFFSNLAKQLNNDFAVEIQTDGQSQLTQPARHVNEDLVEETPSTVSKRVKAALISQTEDSFCAGYNDGGRRDEMQDPRFELKSDLDESFVSDSAKGAIGELMDPQKMTFGKTAGDQFGIPPEREMIKRASRTAQILLQDKGIKMTRPLRQKIISYQSDMGYQLLTRQVQGLIKLGMTVCQAQKRLSYSAIKAKYEQVEYLGTQCSERSLVYRKERHLALWQGALEWHRQMVRLSIRAYEHRQKGEKLLLMLILTNIRKVQKQERKWLYRSIQSLKCLKAQRLFQAWALEIKRRKCKRLRQRRMKRNVILAISAVLDREKLEIEDYLYQKSLYKVLYAIKIRAKQRALTRGRIENAQAHHERFIVRQKFRALQLNVIRRKEMKKDAITRQLMDEDAGEDQFFTVQVKIQGTKTAAREISQGASLANQASYMVNLARTQRTRVEIPATAERTITLKD